MMVATLTDRAVTAILIVSASQNTSSGDMGRHSAQLNQEIEDRQHERHKHILRRLERGVADGDLPAGVNLPTLAADYTALLDGLALQARDGLSRKTLKAAAACAMAAWDGLVGVS